MKGESNLVAETSTLRCGEFSAIFCVECGDSFLF